MFTGCKTCKALGLSDPQQIKDDQFSATGVYNGWSLRAADKGRLFGVDTWCADKTDPFWLEVDFISTFPVMAIGIQGDPTWMNYVTSFKLKYRTKDLVSDWTWVFDDTYAVEKVGCEEIISLRIMTQGSVIRHFLLMAQKMIQ